jgi:hypothetical protein
MSADIVWKIVTTLRRNILASSELPGTAFNASPNTGLFTQFSLPLKRAYVPLALIPTSSFNDIIAKCALRSGHRLQDKKLPYHLELPGVGPCTVSIQFRLYVPNIAALTVRVKPISGGLTKVPFDSLFSLRTPPSPSIVRAILRWSIGILEGDPAASMAGPEFMVYSGFQFRDAAESDALGQYWQLNKRRFVGLLIGNTNYEGMHDDIITSVDQKCEQLNKKTTKEHLVFNKQGALYITSTGDRGHRQGDRFSRAMDLAEIGMVYRAFLDNTYPARRSGQEAFLDYTFGLIKSWIEQPRAILSSSYTNTLHWEVLVSEFALVDKLRLIERENSSWLEPLLMERSEYFAQVSDRWWDAPAFAATMLERARMIDSSYLNFIHDQNFRASIAADLREADRSLLARNYKAAVVLAGAAAEAILLALLEQSAIPIAKLREKGLAVYVRAVREHGLVRDAGALDLIDSTLREWRNLVHPGLVLRTGVTLDERRAKLAVSSVHLIAEHISDQP